MKNLLVIALVALVFYMLMRKPAAAAPANTDVYIPAFGTTATPTSYTPANTAPPTNILSGLQLQ